MTVTEVIKKYNLEGFDREYHNQYGNLCNVSYAEFSQFFKLQVKGININFPTNHVTITVIEEQK